jgi:hypothetical protein
MPTEIKIENGKQTIAMDTIPFLKNNDITLKYISDGYLLGPMIMLQCILDDVKIKNRYYATYIHKKGHFTFNKPRRRFI